MLLIKHSINVGGVCFITLVIILLFSLQRRKALNPAELIKLARWIPIARVALAVGLHRFPMAKAWVAFHYWSCLIALVQTFSPIPFFLYLKSLQQINETITQQAAAWAEPLIMNDSCINLQSKHLFFEANANKACHTSPSPVKTKDNVHYMSQIFVLMLAKCIQNPEVSGIRVPRHSAYDGNLLFCFHLLPSYHFPRCL